MAAPLRPFQASCNLLGELSGSVQCIAKSLTIFWNVTNSHPSQIATDLQRGLNLPCKGIFQQILMRDLTTLKML